MRRRRHHDAFDGTIVDYKWDLGSGSFTLDTGTTPTTSACVASLGPQTIQGPGDELR